MTISNLSRAEHGFLVTAQEGLRNARSVPHVYATLADAAPGLLGPVTAMSFSLNCSGWQPPAVFEAELRPFVDVSLKLMPEFVAYGQEHCVAFLGGPISEHGCPLHDRSHQQRTVPSPERRPFASTGLHVCHPTGSRTTCGRLRRMGFASHALIPIATSTSILGALHVASMEADVDLDAGLTSLRVLADYTALLLENTRLVRLQTELRTRSDSRQRRLEHVQRVGANLKLDLAPEAIADRVVEAARDALGFRGAVLNLIDRPGEEGARARVVAAAGLPADGVAALMANDYPVADIEYLFRPRFRLSRSFFIPSGQLDVPDGTEMTSWTNQHLFNHGPNAWEAGDELLVPLTTSEDSLLIGFLSVDDPENGRRPEKDDVEVLEIFADQAVVALRNAELLAEARRLADQDPVTGLLNHRAVHARYEAEFAVASSTSGPLALICLDLDNFKLINDTHGHHVGDLALRHVARLLPTCTREMDSVARIGGDEFLLVLPGANRTAAGEVAERLLEVTRQSPFEVPDVGLLPLRISVGVAAYPEDAAQRHGLLTLADMRLYEAKRSLNRSVVTGVQPAVVQLEALPGFEALNSLVATVGNKDRYTCEHSEQVATFACLLAGQMGLSRQTQRTLRVAGLLHDVGKIGVPDEVLRKPGPLTAEEWAIMRRHVSLSTVLVKAMAADRDIIAAVQHHHERWDGAGYPHGLAGTDVPLLGRIMIVADAVSAMLTDRPYRKGLSQDAVVRELRGGAGSQFDPSLVEPFIAAFERAEATAA